MGSGKGDSCQLAHQTSKVGVAMTRILLIFSVASLLAACGTQSAEHSNWDKARLACADVGIAPGSGGFDQCVFNLYYSLWDDRNLRDD